ncbi:MAG: Lrp/AsnC family transcriptional regulator [Nanoarchaeota archaeon]
MIQIGSIERKLIRELGNDARQSYKELAKKIKSKKEVVAYHITKLEREGVIKKYMPVFSQARLGITVYKIYVRFQGLSSELEGEMIKELEKSPYVNWIAKSVGTWDLMLAFYCRNILEFAEHKSQLLFKKYGKYIQDYTISILEDALVYTRDYLINAHTRERPGLIYCGSLIEEKIDENQKEIIRLIRNNARYEVADLARRLKLNVKTVMNKIKDLENRKIIQGHITTVDQEKLGVVFFKVQIFFQDYSDEQYRKVLNFCKSNKYVVNLMKSVSDWEIELEVEAETSKEVYQFAKDLRITFPTILKKVDLHIITKEIKVDYLPAWF